MPGIGPLESDFAFRGHFDAAGQSFVGLLFWHDPPSFAALQIEPRMIANRAGGSNTPPDGRGRDPRGVVEPSIGQPRGAGADFLDRFCDPLFLSPEQPLESPLINPFH